MLVETIPWSGKGNLPDPGCLQAGAPRRFCVATGSDPEKIPLLTLLADVASPVRWLWTDDSPVWKEMNQHGKKNQSR